MSARNIINFEEEWEILKMGIGKLQNIVDELEPNFTAEEHMKLYTAVYDICNIYKPKICSEHPFPSDPLGSKLPRRYYIEKLYDKYNETREEYIISTVLPALRGMKDDLLLRELLRRWLNYDAMTTRLSKIFYPLHEQLCPLSLKEKYFPLKETSFSSFKRLVYEAMNKEILDAIFSVMERKLTGEKIDPVFVINTLGFYVRFHKWTEKNNAKAVLSSKKIKLISSDDVTFEVDYRISLMSKRFEDITETISVGDVDTISVPKMSSKMLDMVVGYYKKPVKHSELTYWNTLYAAGGPETLLDLATIACYMKIDSLEQPAWRKLGELIKDKTPEEISQIFGAADDLNSKLLKKLTYME